MLRARSTHKEYGHRDGVSSSGREDHAPLWPPDVACHSLLRALLDRPGPRAGKEVNHGWTRINTDYADKHGLGSEWESRET